MRTDWQTRLLNMMFLPEKQDDVRTATLSQILDKIQRDILDNHGNNNLGSDQQGSNTGGLMEPTVPSSRTIPNIPGYGEQFNPEDFLMNEDSYSELYNQKMQIMNKNPNHFLTDQYQKLLKISENY